MVWDLHKQMNHGWQQEGVPEKPRRTGADSVPVSLKISSLACKHPWNAVHRSWHQSPFQPQPPPLWQLIKCSFCILLFHWFTLTWLYIGGGDGYLLSFWSFTFTYIFWLVSLFTAVQKEDRVTILICTALLWNGQSHRIIEYLKVDETHKIIMLHVGVT